MLVYITTTYLLAFVCIDIGKWEINFHSLHDPIVDRDWCAIDREVWIKTRVAIQNVFVLSQTWYDHPNYVLG